MFRRPAPASLAILVIAMATLLPYSLRAEDPERLRVGLVLGGGGARGAAHIGVLRELERMRIPIDAIAGTSMGAIVGGLYATGMSAGELEELVSSMDWNAALSDRSPRTDLSFRRKQDDTDFPINFEMGVRDGEAVLPMGVIQGQKLDLILRELTLDASHIRDFDDLPVPFRAIAADLVTGEPYVMSSGDLATSIRASMSVPAAFAPVRVGDRLLVDGGIVGNLPIDVMRTMGVDVIIAVDVEFPLYGLEELDSALTISEQILTIVVRKETLRQIDTMGENDVLIRPDLGKFGSTDFAGVIETIEPGVDATRAQSGGLQSLALDEASYVHHLAGRKPRPAVDGPLSFVRVSHDGRLSPAVLEARLESGVGDPIDASALAADASRLYGLQLYEKVSYRLLDEGEGTGVEFQARSKSWGPNFLQFGIAMEDDFEGSTAFNVAARHTRAGLNRLGAEWRTDLQLGTDPLLRSEFYQPLSFDSRFFVAPRIAFEQSNFNAFSDQDTVARFRDSRGEAALDAGFEIGRIGELRAGVFRGAGEARIKVGDSSIPNIDFDTGGAFARLRFDTLDNAFFPTRGIRADVNWVTSQESFGADNSFDIVESDFDVAASRGKNAFLLGLSYATTVRNQSNVQDYFPLGGFLRLSGLKRGAIAGPHAGLARLVYYRRIGESGGGLFEMPFYLGASAEAGNVWQTRSDMSFDSTLVNGSLFAGFDTFIGPVYLGAGFAEGGRTNYYLFIGSPPN
jgi:NTE family protein